MINFPVFCLLMTDKNTFFQQKKTLNAAGRLLDLSTPLVMGIVNLTPDSFYAGSRNQPLHQALDKTGQMLEEGASIIDIGAYSSRPRAENIPEKEEVERLLPVLKAIAKEFPEAVISIDTFRSGVAKAAISEGAHIINDISAGELDSEMFQTIAKLNVPYILMHMKGTPQNMQEKAEYEDVFEEVSRYFVNKVSTLQELGVKDLVIDPGFGFAKKPKHSFELLSKLEQFQFLGLPILAGVSRKSMIYKTLGITAEEALNGTAVLNTVALMKGASILRVHDVKEAVEAVKLASSCQL